MGDYVVGSVADLISNTNSSKIQSKKLKLKFSNNDESHSTLIDCKNNNPANVISKVKAKKTHKIVVNKILEQDFPFNNALSDAPLPNVKSKTEKFRTKLESKKRKKPNTVDDGEMLTNKKAKGDLFEENHVPSDSENDEDPGKNSRGNKKFAKKQIESASNENTVFVGNIPVNYDKLKICKAFSKFGEIQNARIRCIPVGDINMSKKVAAIKKKFNPKRNSLVAYVNFKSMDSAKAAVKANGMVIDGHHLRIDFADSNKERDNNKAVFVGGLPFDIEDDELWEFFQSCGTINSVRIIRDSQTSMGKGFGYVNFDSTAAVELALQMNGEELKKREINVQRCVNSRKKNKLNAFGKQKSKELANQLLCKRGKKFKEEKKKLKKGNNKFSNDFNFQGRTANMKQKKKKKLSKDVLRQRKLVKILGTS